MRPDRWVLLLSILSVARVPVTLQAQEADVREAILRTFAALNDARVDEFLSHFVPRAQVVMGGIDELEFQRIRTALNDGRRYDWRPQQIRTRVYGNTAVTTAYVHGTLRLRGGSVVAGPWRYTETRILDQGQWKILQQHFSPLGQGVGQVADPSFHPAIEDPTFAIGTGPLVLIDEAHFNMHTAWGTYRPFAELLRRDGYVVRESDATFTSEVLMPASVLVIGNAMSINLTEDQRSPPLPAFTADEVAAVRSWVHGGGSLLLLIDHNPYPASAQAMATAFGLRFLNCGATYRDVASGRLIFTRAGHDGRGRQAARGADWITYGVGGTLVDHQVTRGIDSVATFFGSAFQTDLPHQPLLVFGPGVACYSARELEASLPDYLQGALLEFGAGRVAVFGEAGMFTAQINVSAGGTKMGMNNPIAGQNPQFVRNVMNWLTRPREPR